VTLSARSVTTAVIAGLVGVAAWLGVIPLVLVSLVAVGALAAGWGQIAGQPRQNGTPIVLAAAGFLALLAAWQTRTEPVLRYVSVVIALALAMSFLAEMLRKDGRANLVNSLSATITGAIIATGFAGWVAAVRSETGAALVVTGALALVFAAAIVALPIHPGWLAAAITIWVASGVGLLAGFLLPHTTWDVGVITGATAGITVATFRNLLSDEHRYRETLTGIATAIVPIAVAGILLYALKWLLL
jgi:hypothetical protein